MSLRQRIEEELLNAVKDKNELTRDVLRGVKGSIKNREIELKSTELNDSEIEKIVVKEVKSRRESIDAFQTAGKTELVETEEKELEILSSYLPEQLPEGDIEKIIDEAISKLGSGANTGAVMKEVSPLLRGKADMGNVSRIVAQKLAK